MIAYQGEPGAYSEAASMAYFGPDAETRMLPCKSFSDVFSAVAKGNAAYGVIPIENSLGGSIHRNYDLMLRNQLVIQGELHLRIEHCLMSLPGVGLKDLRTVHSHPQALSQCEANLEKLGLERIAEADTAGSARLIKERNDLQAAAIASYRAAKVYGLQVLMENLQDNPENYTRFLVLAEGKPEAGNLSTGDYKSSIVFSLHNQPGALFKALSVFALREIDLTKIESRPLQDRPMEYLFYVDFAGHIQQPHCERALSHLAEMAPFLRILGSYPRHRLKSNLM